jgi:cytochrome c553
MRRTAISLSLISALLLSFVIVAVVRVRAHDDDDRDSRVRQGLRISPVRLDLRGKNREQVGLGSYLVNAVGSCADCHSCPTYTPGHNPYGPPFGPPGGGDGQVNPVNYLAGGVVFAPPGVVSANLTPDAVTGRPEGHTFSQFKTLIRTGHDADEGGRILQVMPWPVYRHMNDQDLRAIYEYLRAIPHAEPGTCVAPGQ